MRPKLVSLMLALGILLLGGGGVFAATRPTRHPAMKPAAAVTGATAAHPATAGATARHTATATRGAQAGPTRVLLRHGASLSTRTAAAAHLGGLMPAVTYVVKPGDTLSGIAEWFKLHGYADLYTANRSVIGSNPGLIIPGERITIDHGGVMSLHPATHTNPSGA